MQATLEQQIAHAYDRIDYLERKLDELATRVDLAEIKQQQAAPAKRGPGRPPKPRDEVTP